MWDLDNHVDIIVKRPLDGELGLVTKVNLAEDSITKVELDTFSRSVFHADLACFALRSSVEFPEDKHFSITSCHVGAFDLFRALGASGG